MAHTVNFAVPRMGEPIEGARLVAWNVPPGQAFRAGDVLLEIETDKSIVEVPAAQDGRMLEHLVAVDGRIDADTVVARIELDGDAPAAGPAAAGEPGSAPPAAPVPAPAETSAASAAPSAASAPSADAAAPAAGRGARRPSTPAARRIARECGLDLDAVAGSGPDGRITQADAQAAADARTHISTRSGTAPYAGAGPGAGPGAREPLPPPGAAGMCERDVPTRHGMLHAVQWQAAAPASAPQRILLHGVFGDAGVWAGTAAALQRAGLAATAIELPCHGRSASAAAGLDAVAEAVADAIAALCPGPVALVGHSYGGAVAARAARRPGLDVVSLTLLAPAGLGTGIAQDFLDGVLHAESDEALAREIRKITADGAAPSPAYLGELRRRIAADRDRLEAFCRAVARRGVQQADIAPDLAALACPVALVHGRRDAIIPWEHALNAPPRVALHLAPHAGHMVQWEAAALVSELLARRA